MDVLDAGAHKEIIAKLDYPAPKCPHCQGQMAKYDLQNESKVSYLEYAGYKTLIRLKKRRFCCKVGRKMAVTETPLVKKKITQKLIEKAPMATIAESLAVSTSTVIRKLKEFEFKMNLNYLPEHMSWDVATVRGVTVSIGR